MLIFPGPFHVEFRITGGVSGLISAAPETLGFDPDMRPRVSLAGGRGKAGRTVTPALGKTLEDLRKVWSSDIKALMKEHIKGWLCLGLCGPTCSPGMVVSFVPSLIKLVALFGPTI